MITITLLFRLLLVGIGISEALAGNEPDLVETTEEVRLSANFKGNQNWFRRIVQGARQGLRSFRFAPNGSVRIKM